MALTSRFTTTKNSTDTIILSGICQKMRHSAKNSRKIVNRNIFYFHNVELANKITEEGRKALHEMMRKLKYNPDDEQG